MKAEVNLGVLVIKLLVGSRCIDVQAVFAVVCVLVACVNAGAVLILTFNLIFGKVVLVVIVSAGRLNEQRRLREVALFAETVTVLNVAVRYVVAVDAD